MVGRETFSSGERKARDNRCPLSLCRHASQTRSCALNNQQKGRLGLLARKPEDPFCHDFATVRLPLIRFIQRIRDFSSRDVSFYAEKADYALYAARIATLTR